MTSDKDKSEKDSFWDKNPTDIESSLGRSEINLSNPWDQGKNIPVQGSVLLSGSVGPDIQKHFVSTRSKVHETWIIETHKTKRATLSISALLFIASAALAVFSPEDREILSYGIAGSMLLLSAGVAGYGFFKVKSESISAEASKDNGE